MAHKYSPRLNLLENIQIISVSKNQSNYSPMFDGQRIKVTSLNDGFRWDLNQQLFQKIECCREPATLPLSHRVSVQEIPIIIKGLNYIYKKKYKEIICTL